MIEHPPYRPMSIEPGADSSNIVVLELNERGTLLSYIPPQPTRQYEPQPDRDDPDREATRYSYVCPLSPETTADCTSPTVGPSIHVVLGAARY
jgi:hypothetical protein